LTDSITSNSLVKHRFVLVKQFQAYRFEFVNDKLATDEVLDLVLVSFCFICVLWPTKFDNPKTNSIWLLFRHWPFWEKTHCQNIYNNRDASVKMLGRRQLRNVSNR